MPNEEKPGLLHRIRQRAGVHADALRNRAAAALREGASELREALGPDNTQLVRDPERPFGRDEGGSDVKRVVWTGHTVQSPEGQAYFAAAGLTRGGYYRAAEVQVYGADELWRWDTERHTDRQLAIAVAESMVANRHTEATGTAASAALAAYEAHSKLHGVPTTQASRDAWLREWRTLDEEQRQDAAGAARREIFGKEQTEMVELPEHVKAKADAEIAKKGAERLQMVDAGPSVNDKADPYDGKAMEAQRQQQRQNTLLAKQDKSPEPDKG